MLPWRVTELWDFGEPEEIDLPGVQSGDDARPPSVLSVALKLWRRKRDYERRHST